MAKIDEIKEILNTLRIAMSILAGILVVLFGRIFSKYENTEIDITFWLIVSVTFIVILIEAIIIYKISQKTKEIGKL